MASNEKLVPGMVLGRYELLLPIAQGGMATVWAARQRGTRGFNKTVAIKTMLPALSDDAQFEQMFLDEAALAARIHHPNVAEILDLGEQDDVLYIVMEWIEGEALSVIHKAAKRNQSQIPLRLALRVARQAAAALHAAHELRDENENPLQLVHRDVSPQNILCTYDGLVKLVDFGVAKAVGRAGGETTAGQLKGKVPYMSPEQARGGVVDRRTDVFALGIVLYKLTTGLHPFLGDNDIATMRNIISRPLIPPRVKNPNFPAEVEQILLRSMQKDPEKRYQNMAEVGLALDRVSAALGVGDEDLGAFVRSTMGDTGTKRRAAIRDVVRAADERYATGQHPIVNLAAPQTIHENVSDAALTRMHTGIAEAVITDPGPPSAVPSSRATLTGFPAAASVATPPSVRSSSTWPGTNAGVDFPSVVPPARASVDPDSQIRTDQAVVVTPGPVVRRRSGAVPMAIAATIAAVAIAGGVRFSMVKRGSGDGKGVVPVAAAPGPVAQPSAVFPSSQGPASAPTLPAPAEPKPAVTVAATAAPIETAAPAATHDGGAPAFAVAGGKHAPSHGGAGKPRSTAEPAEPKPAPPPAGDPNKCGTLTADGKRICTDIGY